ncbi:23S rRNA (uracil(747)-C(5))-methyltransferase RlmC [Maribrevibacterium harenarium]|uniref:23S rRNA (uracil(747)-C(5))-methyltransferase RlmC n=1 Tax=Maribrevibacterium harenarium TaxID=2589817 RepID=A0A501WFC7_9GAMM|nr:23S rRNA (uracil(747)-C(5))-methyltransferase RlmC [Maribrevibacterium harenarium]TPE45687.1 23S rRNA (uracil(747)-C(5))-methyltransferase RlmC [Maribrevibacterium harenarium]
MHCVHFASGRCLSCRHLETDYSTQVATKESHLRQLLSPYKVDTWLPFVKSPEQGFRNKAKMVVLGAAHEPILGIVAPDGTPTSLVDCSLYTDAMRSLLSALPNYVRSAGIPPYNVAKQKGELKFILLTESQATGAMMLRFVLRSNQAIERLQRILPDLLQEFPRIEVVSANIQPVHMAILEGDEEIFLTDQQVIWERFNQIPLAIRPKSFFQTNWVLAPVLYQTAANWVQQIGAQKVWDLFCGVGGFGLHCLSNDTQLWGIEIEPEAIRCAKQSACELGKDKQVQFSAFDATSLSPDAASFPELIIVNPPRRGIGLELATLINQSGVKDVIYSSCNAITLAQDLAVLDQYRLAKVQGFDFFPHTDHYETLVHLQRQ